MNNNLWKINRDCAACLQNELNFLDAYMYIK